MKYEKHEYGIRTMAILAARPALKRHLRRRWNRYMKMQRLADRHKSERSSEWRLTSRQRSFAAQQIKWIVRLTMSEAEKHRCLAFTETLAEDGLI